MVLRRRTPGSAWLALTRLNPQRMGCAVATFFYYLRRLVAIALGLALTGYSAWASWSHQHDLIGPLAAMSAAGMLCFAEYAWRDRRWVHFGLLGVLGISAAVISGFIVLERVSHSQEARLGTARSANLPRVEARKALAAAQKALEKAEAEASAECVSGRKTRCTSLEVREQAARKRVAAARSELVGLGAETTVNPAAVLLGEWAETFRLATLLGLPLWLELAAPAVLAYGFGPGRRKAPEPQPETKRRREKRATPRKKPAANDQVVSWVEEFRRRNGRAPKIPEVRGAFQDISRTTAWRRSRSK